MRKVLTRPLEGQVPHRPTLNAKKLRRLLTILGLGSLLVAGAVAWKHSLRPIAAPAYVQKEGRALLAQQLTKIRESEFGKSERGKLLAAQIESYLREERIVFTADIPAGQRALCSRPLIGAETWYIKVLEMNRGIYLQQLPHQVAEVTFHEALHSLKGGFHNCCLEEECDAFTAGSQAEAAVLGGEQEGIVIVEGYPAAEFVRRSYHLPSKPDYQPLAESPGWLKKRAGL